MKLETTNVHRMHVVPVPYKDPIAAATQQQLVSLQTETEKLPQKLRSGADIYDGGDYVVTRNEFSARVIDTSRDT
jgi:hypothetical protein